MSLAVPILFELHKNLQRLGSFVVCASVASDSRTVSSTSLAADYAAVLRRGVALDQSDSARIEAFLAARALVRKYDPHGTASSVAQALVSGRLALETQDYWLSRPDIKSGTGGEREQSFLHTVSAAEELAFVVPSKRSRGSAGRAIVFGATAVGLLDDHGAVIGNPFADWPTLHALIYWRILDADRLFIRRLAELLRSETSFTRLASQSAGMLRAVLADIPNAVTSRRDRERVQKLASHATRLSSGLSSSSVGAGAAIQTLYRPLEDILLPRIEFMVDVGLLTKSDPYRYTYQPTPAFKIFSSDVSQSDYSATRYWSTVAAARGVPYDSVDFEGILAHLRPAYLQLKGLTGYANIKDTVGLANVMSAATGPWRIAELRDAEAHLRGHADQMPAGVRLIADRFRKLESFRMEGD
jgi:hypothetical protein